MPLPYETPQRPLDEFTTRHGVLVFEPCTGCHTGVFAYFNHFLDKNDIPDDSIAGAFAYWLQTAAHWDLTADTIPYTGRASSRNVPAE